MSEAKTVKEVLVAMRWMIKHVGWCQKASTQVDDNGKVVAMCLFGAMHSVVKSDGLCYDVRKHLLQHINTAGYLVDYNDAPGRTKEEVLSLLDDAIKEAP